MCPIEVKIIGLERYGFWVFSLSLRELDLTHDIDIDPIAATFTEDNSSVFIKFV